MAKEWGGVLYAADMAEGTRFCVWPAFGGIEVMEARFERHVFAPHTHETLMLGVIVEGVLDYRVPSGRRVAPAGRLVVVNPGELHSGGPSGEKTLRYTALYPSAATLEAAGLTPSADVPCSVHDDPRLVGAFIRVLRAAGPEEATERLLLALGDLGRRSDAARRGGEGSGPSALERDDGAISRAGRRVVERVEARLREHVEEGVGVPSSDALAAAVGLSSRQLLRLFRAARGTTPTAWTRALRVERAKRSLRAGVAPIEVAVSLGFTDQAHLTRQFRRHVGVTPARYREGWARVRRPGTAGRAPADARLASAG